MHEAQTLRLSLSWNERTRRCLDEEVLSAHVRDLLGEQERSSVYVTSVRMHMCKVYV